MSDQYFWHLCILIIFIKWDGTWKHNNIYYLIVFTQSSCQFRLDVVDCSTRRKSRNYFLQHHKLYQPQISNSDTKSNFIFFIYELCNLQLDLQCVWYTVWVSMYQFQICSNAKLKLFMIWLCYSYPECLICLKLLALSLVTS